MTDKLGWIVAGVLAALIVGYLLGRRQSSAEHAPPSAPLPGPEPAIEPRPVDASIAPPPPVEPPRRPGSVPPPAPAGHLPSGIAPAPAPSGSGGGFLGGARSTTRREAVPAARPHTPSGPPARTAPPPPARTSGGPQEATVGRVAPAGHAASADPGRDAIRAVQSWGYQLQRVDLRALAASSYDLVVIDHSKDGSDEGALKPAEVAQIARKPDGGRRLVVSYLSIGEAESYRGYWQDGWKRNPPSFLLGENPEWEENYSVRFWDPAWQSIILGSPEACLDRIVAQGFDGVYLDKCDVTDDLRTHFPQAARERPDMERDMVAFVTRLAAHARRTRPGFLVIMQNAEPLLRFPELRAAIDGVGKEELYFGLDGGEGANDTDAIGESRNMLKLAQADGKVILTVEYLGDRGKQQQASEQAARDGFVLFLSPRNRELASLGSGPVVA